MDNNEAALNPVLCLLFFTRLCSVFCPTLLGSLVALFFLNNSRALHCKHFPACDSENYSTGV